MFNIDKSLKNIMGTTKRSSNTFNFKQKSPMFKPVTSNRTNNIVNNMLSNKQYKPASPKMQMQWKSFSTPMKNIMRSKYPDSDGDRIPDRWDCKPNNPFMTMAFIYPTEQEMKRTGVKKISFPVKKLYNMRADYGIDKTKTFRGDNTSFSNSEERIRTKIENDWREKNKERIELNSNVNQLLLDDAIRTNTLDDWNPTRIEPPYPERKEVFKEYVKEEKDKYEKEKGFKLGSPKIKKSSYYYVATLPIKFTKEQLNEKRKNVMVTGHTQVEEDFMGRHGGYIPNSPEADKYMNNLTEAIQSEKPLVPPIDLSMNDIRNKHTGEARHRLSVLQNIKQKNVDIIVPDTHDYKTIIHKGNLKIVPRSEEEEKEWRRNRTPVEQIYPEHAPIEKQQEWKNTPEAEKEVIRELLPDGDGDNKPKGFDCDDTNKNKQDSKPNRLMRQRIDNANIQFLHPNVKTAFRNQSSIIPDKYRQNVFMGTLKRHPEIITEIERKPKVSFMLYNEKEYKQMYPERKNIPNGVMLSQSYNRLHGEDLEDSLVVALNIDKGANRSPQQRARTTLHEFGHVHSYQTQPKGAFVERYGRELARKVPYEELTEEKIANEYADSIMYAAPEEKRYNEITNIKAQEIKERDESSKKQGVSREEIVPQLVDEWNSFLDEQSNVVKQKKEERSYEEHRKLFNEDTPIEPSIEQDTQEYPRDREDKMNVWEK